MKQLLERVKAIESIKTPPLDYEQYAFLMWLYHTYQLGNVSVSGNPKPYRLMAEPDFSALSGQQIDEHMAGIVNQTQDSPHACFA